MVKFTSGTEDRRKEGELVWRIGKLLGLQTERMAGTVTTAILAGTPLLDEIGGMEMQAGESGADVH